MEDGRASDCPFMTPSGIRLADANAFHISLPKVASPRLLFLQGWHGDPEGRSPGAEGGKLPSRFLISISQVLGAAEPIILFCRAAYAVDTPGPGHHLSRENLAMRHAVEGSVWVIISGTSFAFATKRVAPLHH